MNNVPISIPPEAAGVVTALSQMGYNAQTAIADLLDNSIQAGANQISIMFALSEGWLEIKDNGHGMSDPQICEAFVYGKRRDTVGLGKFGMGLKTAATSLGKAVSIFSNANNGEVKLSNTYTLALDQIEKTNKWEIYQSDTETVFTRSFVRWINGLTKEGPESVTGTVVRVEKLRNLLDREYADKQSKPYQKSCKAFEVELIEFIGLVFHRYIENGGTIKVNGKPVDGTKAFAIAETLWQRDYTQAGRNTDAIVIVSVLKTQDLAGVYYYRENRIIDFGQLRHGLRKEDQIVVVYSFDAEADCFLEANTQKSRIERVNLDSDWLNEIDAAVREARQAKKETPEPAVATEPAIEGAVDETQANIPSGAEEISSEGPDNQTEAISNLSPVADTDLEDRRSGETTDATTPEEHLDTRQKLGDLSKEELLTILRNIKNIHPELLEDYV